MRTELTTILVLKAIVFTGFMFQIDSVSSIMLQVDPTTGMDLYKIVQNFGIVGFLILGIKYFINESKRLQSEFSQKWKEQEKRHKEERDKQDEFHQRENELKELKLEKLREEVLELRVALSKHEETH